MRPGPPRFIAAGKVVEAHGMFRDYEVRKHDHIDAIARELGITRKVIVEENHLDAPYAIHPGDILRVPVAKAYVVQAGDTLREIGKRFSVGVDDLAQLNHISARKDLRPGQRLALPADFRDRGPIRLPRVMVADTRPAPTVTRREARREREIAAAAAPPTVLTPPAPTYSARPAPPPRTIPPPAYAAAPTRPEPRYTQPPPPAAVESASAPASGDITQAARGRFIWPLRGGILSAFGVKGLGRRNDGVDIGAPMGTVVRAAAGGDVVYAGNQVPGFGNLVLVKHPDGWVTAYAHLDTVSVKMRQEVAQGQELGVVGQTGGVSEPQLHFEMRYAATPQDKAKPIDPMLVLPQ
jgi:murein DD-endopeptidase MepM/ murein hydrolase activator NlpD